MKREILARELARRLQLPPQALEFTRLAGGDINQALRVDGGARVLFVKLNRAERLPMFEAEWRALETIRSTAAIAAPEPLFCGIAGEHAFLAMQFVDLAGRPDPARFGRALATMHASCAERFGFEVDNTIGSTPQRNRWSRDWVEFWRRQRLGYQLELGASGVLDSALLDAGKRLCERLDGFFSAYRPRPSLLHGDLWSGNWGADAAGDAVIYDPACYYGDHEADLAMMELFGHPGEAFFAAYREHFPIDAGYSVRRELYNLYHVLNHANLFGGGYPARARSMIDALLARV